MNGRYRRVDHIAERRVANSTYLIDPRGNNIHSLNATGAAIWGQLSEARSRAELIEVLHTAFHSVGRARIERDIEDILAELLECRLITTCE